jgi:molybdate transport system ATP-binding protein
MELLLKNISLPLAAFALELDIEIREQATAIVGPSGSGKTSLLDLIAGLRQPRNAFIRLDGRVLTDTEHRIFIPPRERHIGYVPQDLALFPHLSVRRNLLYGQKPGTDAAGLFSTKHVVDVLELTSLTDRNVLELSGGEKQRVALGRALLTAPRLLLLDEPLANLDAGLKSRIIPYLRRIRDEFHMPMLYVTHDLDEVVTLCDKKIEMRHGRIVSA